MAKTLKFILESRQQGKTERLREETKAAIESGSQIYLPESPSIGDETKTPHPLPKE